MLECAVQLIKERTLIPAATVYPPLYSYLFAAVSAPTALALTMLGVIPAPSDFASLSSAGGVLSYLPGRLLSTAFGLATVLTAYRTAKDLWGGRAAAMAGGTLALSPLHATYSAYALPDAAMTFFVTLSLRHCLLSVQKGASVHLDRAAVFAGLALAAKYNCATIIFPLALAALIRGRDPRQALRLLLLVAAAAAFGAIGWTLSPSKIVEGVSVQWFSTTQRGNPSMSWAPPWLGLSQALWRTEGVLALLYLAAVAGAIQRRRREETILFALIVPAFLNIGSLKRPSPHYFLFALPALALLAGRAYDRVLSTPFGRPLPALLLVGLLALPGWAAAKKVRLAFREDSRRQAHRWIQERAPEGSGVVMDWAYTPRLWTAEQKRSALSGPHRRLYERTLAAESSYETVPLRYELPWVAAVDADFMVLSSRSFDRFVDGNGPRASDPLRPKFEAARTVYRALLKEPGAVGWRRLVEFDSGNGPRIVVLGRP
ncbi:MAG: glycosyltransferase family 39 protein [Elusimicrobia bacterium]|nr:glycosyltransferase family 39 protein [Elusimicrobiota bacterium]